MNSVATDPAAPIGAAEESGQPGTPVAVVWCRQVDNEEESPGYTTIPEEFPGKEATVETIRAVGQLTINVADTHDYWDPNPGISLSYYPNLFLYPAFGGRYTCIGRMFLSKEDRPRLGVKTLVLNTQELLRLGAYGVSVLRWASSMGGPPKSSARLAATPEAALYGILGEGFLFHRGSTEPVLVIASDKWDASMRVIFDLVRSLPSALVSRCAILAFPYFLPRARTELRDLLEEVPTSLTVMRVAHSEASGERHKKRIASWESAPLTVYDVTDGGPGLAPRGKESTPVVLQYIREQAEEKLGPIRHRVDLVELPKLRAHISDPERQSGRERRQEAKRIGAAMESAALLLHRARGRHVPANPEVARRAQEYLDVEVPPDDEGTPREAAVVDPIRDRSAPGFVPSWLQSAGPPVVPPAKVLRKEVVPVPLKDDPSRLSAGARSPTLGLAVPPEGTTGATDAELRRVVGQELDRRLGTGTSGSTPAPADLARSLDLAIGAARQEFAGEIARRVAATEDRITEMVRELSKDSEDHLPSSVRTAVEDRVSKAEAGLAKSAGDLREELGKLVGSEGEKLRETLLSAMASEVERRVRAAVDSQLSEARLTLAEAGKVSFDRARRATVEETENAAADVDRRIRSAEEETRIALASDLGRQLREAADQENALRIDLENRLLEVVEARLVELEGRHSSDVTALEGRLAPSRNQAFEPGGNPASGQGMDPTEPVGPVASQELEMRLQDQFEARIHEALEGERAKFRTLVARVKSEVDSSTQRVIDSVQFGQAVASKVAATLARQPEPGIPSSDGPAHPTIQELESFVCNELDELDHRTTVLTERLMPVVRSMLERLADLEKTPAGTGNAEELVAQLRGELQAQSLHFTAELQRRFGDLRRRMDTAISHQSRVWLTLVQQLSQLTSEREALAESTAGTTVTPAWEEPEPNPQLPEYPLPEAPPEAPPETAPEEEQPARSARYRLRSRRS